MFHPRKNIATALVLVLLAATSAYAGESPSEINQRIGSGDPFAGKEKSALCQGCHGEDGNSASPKFPKLAGQWSDYIQKQFRNFQNLARINETMNEVAISVNDFEDLFDIAAYFASQKQMGSTPIENEEEQKLYLEGEKLYLQGNEMGGAFRCIKCHGINGRGEPLNNNLFPVLGGQHKAYLVKQLKEFQSGFRLNDPSGMMARITSHLTDHDIEALATYLSREPAPVAIPAAAPLPVAVSDATAASAPAAVPLPVAAPVPATMTLLLEDKPILVEGSNFDAATSQLKKSANEQLNRVVTIAAIKLDTNLEVIGYTSVIGTDQKNIKLAIARAGSVKKYLVDHGIAAERITVKGKTSLEPAENSRVEIHLVIKK